MPKGITTMDAEITTTITEIETITTKAIEITTIDTAPNIRMQSLILQEITTETTTNPIRQILADIRTKNNLNTIKIVIVKTKIAVAEITVTKKFKESPAFAGIFFGIYKV